MKTRVFIAQSMWINYHADPEIRVKVFGSKKEADNQIKAWEKSYPVDQFNVRPMDLAGMEVVDQGIEVELWSPDKPIFYNGKKKK